MDDDGYIPFEGFRYGPSARRLSEEETNTLMETVRKFKERRPARQTAGEKK